MGLKWENSTGIIKAEMERRTGWIGVMAEKRMKDLLINRTKKFSVKRNKFGEEK